jgi:hypothetical protein
MEALNPYLCCALQMFNKGLALELSAYEGSLCSHCSGCRRKRLHDDGQEDPDSQDKRQRVDRSEASGRFSPGHSDSDSAAPSHLIPLDTRSYEECNEQGLSNFSQFDALAAVAVAAAQAGPVEDCVAHTDPLSQNPPYSQQSLIHPRSSSSIVGDMVNYGGTATTSTLFNAAKNTSQGLDARLSVERSGLHLTDVSDSDFLHLWTGDDVVGHTNEELMYMDPLEFSLWEGQDLANRPFELLESDFDLGDRQAS